MGGKCSTYYIKENEGMIISYFLNKEKLIKEVGISNKQNRIHCNNRNGQIFKNKIIASKKFKVGSKM